MRTALLAPLILAVLVAAPALARDAPREGRASIAFADQPGGILEWRIVDSRTVYLHASGKHWYRADLISRCGNLPYAQTLGFATNPDGSFDSFGALIVGGRRCALKTLTALPGEPPPIPKRR